MRALTRDDAAVWCEAHSVGVDPAGHLYFSLDAPHSLLLNSPPAARADELLRALLPQPAEALLWLRPRDAWSESPGDKLFRGLRSAWGIDQPLAERPALLFQPDERSHLLAAFLPALLFGWDAYVVPSAADTRAFAFTSQEALCFVTRTREAQAALAATLHSFSPQPDSSWYFRRLS